jgi:hypothetical protein
MVINGKSFQFSIIIFILQIENFLGDAISKATETPNRAI